jgi:hypothetical protein
MADLKLLAARRKAARFDAAGMTTQAKRAKARVSELEKVAEALEPGPSMSNTKDELLAAAELAGVTADESMTKADILEALNGAE